MEIEGLQPKPEKILIVDDEEPIRVLMSRILALDGHQCLLAASAEEALQQLKTETFSLLISDINMPGKSGIDLLQEVHEIYPDMAVIMVTAVNDHNVAVQSLWMGAFGYVAKPFHKNELIINVTNALQRRKLEIESRVHSTELETLVSLRTADLLQSREETIHKLARAAEFRDNETAQHTLRMGHFCEILAQSAGLDAKTCKMIKIASQLHDVGKIGISDTILLKPGKLTKDEFEEIKKHSDIGYRILGDSKSEILNLGAMIALTHHEKYDGLGYPGGLQGDNIPIYGRIAAICDVFDALTSQRVYKDAMPVDDALKIIKSGRGGHFDPRLTDLFFDNIAKILQVREEFNEADEILPGVGGK